MLQKKYGSFSADTRPVNLKSGTIAPDPILILLYRPNKGDAWYVYFSPVNVRYRQDSI